MTTLSRHARTSARSLSASLSSSERHRVSRDHADQPFIYALGKDSPLEKMYRLGAHILLLGVGHNRNSSLHYAESLVSNHRTKLRRFLYIIGGEFV